ncbi:MAG: hypothetical protein HQK93_04720 [Nitrospirae bacterium]|nr:hypothetical protein [Nitrospirota bacterium]
MPERQAEAMSDVLKQVELLRLDSLATKADIQAVKTDLQTIKADIIKWVAAMLVAQGAVVAAMIKLMDIVR